MSKTRESGFYWVKYPHGVWMIAMYTRPIGWAAFHGDPDNFPHKDDEFAEIDERRIVRERELKMIIPKETTNRLSDGTFI